MWSHHGHDWLNKTQTCRDASKHSMWIGTHWNPLPSSMVEDQEKASHGEAPSEYHKCPMDDKPHVFLATLSACPSLLEISGHHHSQRS